MNVLYINKCTDKFDNISLNIGDIGNCNLALLEVGFSKWDIGWNAKVINICCSEIDSTHYNPYRILRSTTIFHEKNHEHRRIEFKNKIFQKIDSSSKILNFYFTDENNKIIKFPRGVKVRLTIEIECENNGKRMLI